MFVTHEAYYDTLITYEIQIFYFQHDISLYYYAVGYSLLASLSDPVVGHIFQIAWERGS